MKVPAVARLKHSLFDREQSSKSGLKNCLVVVVVVLVLVVQYFLN